MIYRLMKFTVAWKLAVPMAVLIGLMGLPYLHAVPFVVFLPQLTLYSATARQFGLHEPYAVFEASLPLRAWQIFCVRVLSLGAFVWFPAMAMVAAKLSLGGASSRGFAKTAVVIAAVFTVIVLAPLCLGVRKFVIAGKPGRLNYVISFLALLSVVPVMHFIPVIAVLVLCFAATAGLLGYAWARMPESFQIVPADAGTAAQPGPTPPVPQSSKEAGILVWAPLFRPLPSKVYAIFFPAVAVLVLTDAWPLATVFCALVFQQLHFYSHWLFTLPVSRHRLFAMLTLPFLGLMTASCALKICLGLLLMSEPQFAGTGVARMALISITAIVTSSLLGVFLVNFSWWHRVGRRLRTVVPLLYFLAFASGIGIALIRLFSVGLHARESSAGAALAWVSRILPDNILALAGLAMIFLGGLYWIVSKQFCELEVSPFQLKAAAQ